MTIPTSRILVAVSDVFFYAKIRDAFQEGYTLDRARTQGEIPEKARAAPLAAVIVNMNDERLDPYRTLLDVRSTIGDQVPILAFANHEEVETWRRARELGASKVVSRNEFSSRTRALVEELVGTQAARQEKPRVAT